MKKIYLLLSLKDKIHFFLIFSALFVYSLIEIFSIGLVASFVQIIIDPLKIIKFLKFQFISEIITGINRGNLIFYFSFFLFFIFLVKNMYLMFLTYLYEIKIRNFLTNLSSIYFDNLLKKNFDNILVINHSRVTNTLLYEFETLRTVIRTHFVIFREILILILIGVSFILISPVYFLLSFFIMLLASYILIVILKNKLKQLGENSQKLRAGQTEVVDSIFKGIKYIKIFDIFEYFLNIFQAYTLKFNTVSGLMGFLNTVPKLVIEIFLLSFFLIVCNLLYSSSGNDENFLVNLSLLGIIIIRLIPVYTNINASMITLKYANPIINSIYAGIYDIIKTDFNKKSQYKITSKFIPFEELSIQNLIYSYKKNEETSEKNITLKNLQFEIRAGEKIGIIGKTGSGKTTLINCLMGLLKPNSGEIKVNKVSIFSAIADWHKIVSFVPQDIFLMNKNIYSNIALKDDFNQIEKNKINQLLSILDLENFTKESIVMRKLGDKIQKISEGEKQRIGIARALFKDHQVLFLDEATSSLDVNTEKKIMTSIVNNYNKITIITVAHRLSTIEKYDKLILMDNGKIVKIGKPADVILYFKNNN